MITADRESTKERPFLSDLSEEPRQRQQRHNTSNDGFYARVTSSWSAITDIYYDSSFIWRTVTSHPMYSPMRSSLTRLFVLRLALLALKLGCELAVSYPMNWMTSALSERKADEVWLYFRLFLVIAVIAVPLSAMDYYYDSVLYLRVRQAVCRVLLHVYYSDHVYYHVQRHKDVDNPGQRLCYDVDNWTYSSMSLIVVLVNNTLSLFAWSLVLYSIGALMIVWVLIAAACVVFFGVLLFAAKLTHYTFKVIRDECDFTAHIVRTQTNSEIIAFYNGHVFEEEWSYWRLLRALRDAQHRSQWESGLYMLQKTLGHCAWIIPILVLSDAYFRKDIRFGVFTQSMVCFRNLLMALTVVVTKMSKLSSIQATGKRIAEAIVAFEDATKHSQPPTAPVTSTRRGVTITAALEAGQQQQQHSVGGEDEEGTEGTEGKNETKAETGESESGVSPNILSTRTHPVLLNPSLFRGIQFEYHSMGEEKLEVLDETLPYLSVSDVSILVPNTNKLLLYKLNWNVLPSDRVLVTGPSGAGKSSLLRMLSGIWKWGNGTVQVLDKSETMFLPQRPYLPELPHTLNTLKAQLLFPSQLLAMHDTSSDSGDSNDSSEKRDLHLSRYWTGLDARLTDDRLLQVMRAVNLEYVLSQRYGGDGNGDTVDDSDSLIDARIDNGAPHLDRELQWSSALSLGEQQRLAFGRVLVQKPKFVFLDESTSAMDSQNERLMYQLLIENGFTFVSVGHRETLTDFHTSVLRLAGDGTWELMTADNYRRMQHRRRQHRHSSNGNGIDSEHSTATATRSSSRELP